MTPSSDRIRLVVLFGGRSAEHDVSCVTAAHVLRAADPERYDPVAIGITRDGQWVVAEDAVAALQAGAAELPESLSAEGPDVEPQAALVPTDSGQTVVVLPLLHGPMGEDGTVQGLLELLGAPYVGTGVLGSALSMDKAKAKEVITQAGIPQARYRAFRDVEVDTAVVESAVDELGLPAFVKPANLGSSIGVTKAHTLDELHAAVELALSYDEWILIEEAIDAREIELSVLGNTELRVSLPGEVRPAAEFYDYEDKYVDGRAELIIPAPLDDNVTARFQELALQAFRALRADGMARVDFLYEEDGRGPLLNEINTIPGFTPISMYPKLWEASGLPYDQLIDELVRLAVERHERRSKTASYVADHPRPNGHLSAPLEVAADGLAFGEGPRWHDGRLWFSDMYRRQVVALAPGGEPEVVVEWPDDDLSGLGWLPDGRLLVVAMRTRRLMLHQDGGLEEVADLTPHAPFHCNDMVVDSRGSAYVGNFGWDHFGGEEPRNTTLVLVTPDGTARVVADDLAFPNGMVVTPDGGTLVVAESMGARLTAFAIAPDGSLSGRRVWADLRPAAPDGICLDAEGAIWVASPGTNEAMRVAEGGEVLDRVGTGGRMAIACALGGDDRRTLFVCTAHAADPETCLERMDARIERTRWRSPPPAGPDRQDLVLGSEPARCAGFGPENDQSRR